MEGLAGWLGELYKGVDLKEVRMGGIHLDIWFDNLHLDDNDGVTLLDFDFFRQQADFQAAEHMCQICYCDLPGTDFQVIKCGKKSHIF